MGEWGVFEMDLEPRKKNTQNIIYNSSNENKPQMLKF
jgi:hypothetical protein